MVISSCHQHFPSIACIVSTYLEAESVVYKEAFKWQDGRRTVGLNSELISFYVLPYQIGIYGITPMGQKLKAGFWPTGPHLVPIINT